MPYASEDIIIDGCHIQDANVINITIAQVNT